MENKESLKFDRLQQIEMLAGDKLKKIQSQEAPLCAAGIRSAWNIFQDRLSFDGHVWTTSNSIYDQWHANIDKAIKHIEYNTFNRLGETVASLSNYSDDWRSLAGFLLHDIHHLEPWEMYWQLAIAIDNRRTLYDDKRIEIFPRHKEYFDEVSRRIHSITAALTYPVQFIQNVALQEMGYELEEEKFNPMEMMETIGFMIHGRFMQDDYVFQVNQPDTTQGDRNRLRVTGSSETEIVANKAMVFQVLYNLAKNAAKANSQFHHEKNDQVLHNQYLNRGDLKYPLTLELSMKEDDESIQFFVGDDATGMSIDNSLKRIHKEYASRLLSEDSEKLSESEWMRNIQRALGKEQTEILFSWPNYPFALRKLTVGSIFDLQFVAGFSGQSWEIRSNTSGTGLWGVRYITEQLGGVVMGTNKFDGGALFSVTLPKRKNVEKSWEQTA